MWVRLPPGARKDEVNSQIDSIQIDSGAYTFSRMQAVWLEETVKAEPMFYGASVDFASEYGGPITRAFLKAAFTQPWQGARLDTKVTMLIPGFYPCIPGWHHDDVPRERSDGQPEYFNPSYRSEHMTAIVGTNWEVCKTEFALGKASFFDVPLGEKYYKRWHPYVEELITNGWLNRKSLEYGDIVHFNDRTWHRGTQAAGFGWRWFARITKGSKAPIVNEIRNQVQVYLADPIEGW